MKWEERKKIYDGKYLERQAYSKEHDPVFARICDEMMELFHPEKILDCGCANGWLIHQFAQRDVEAWGMEVNQSAVVDGKKRYPLITNWLLQLDCATEKWPFGDNYFDLVVAREFIEHIDDAHLFHVIGEMVRVAKKWVYFETPMVITAAGMPEDLNPQERLSQWCDWLKSLNNSPLSENLKLIDNHPLLVSAYPLPYDIEHPNTHCREFWIGLFQLMGFKLVYFDEEHYIPFRYDGICGLNILTFEKKGESGCTCGDVEGVVERIARCASTNLPHAFNGISNLNPA